MKWLAPLLLCGCGWFSAPTVPTVHGQLGHVDFYWPGVPTSRFAAGALAPLVATYRSNGQSVVAESVVSSRDDVVTPIVTGDWQRTITLQTGAPGTATLSLVDAGGGVIDRVDVEVAAVATLDVTSNWIATASPTWPVAIEDHVYVAPLDSAGKTLVGWWAIHQTSSDFDERFPDEKDFLGGHQDFALVPTKIGPATLTFVAGDARADVNFTITP